jgi:hypothetical protein
MIDAARSTAASRGTPAERSNPPPPGAALWKSGDRRGGNVVPRCHLTERIWHSRALSCDFVVISFELAVSIKDVLQLLMMCASVSSSEHASRVVG